MNSGGADNRDGASPEAPETSAAFLRRFVALAAPYFTSEERWAAWLLTAGVIGLTLLQIAFAVRLNIWNRDFFNALEGATGTPFSIRWASLRCFARRRWGSRSTRPMSSSCCSCAGG